MAKMVSQVKEATSVLNRFTLEGKKALVTGGAGGIGRSTASAFAEMGADVAIVEVPSKMEKAVAIAENLANKWSVKAMAVEGDVSDPGKVDEALNKIVKDLGTIDVVHSNAGILLPEDGPDMPFEYWQKALSVNYTGMFLINRGAARIMREHKHGGSIINTASMSAHIVNPGLGDGDAMVAYTSTKAAVKHLTKAMALNLIKHGIRVNSVSYGYAFSGIHDNMEEEHIKFWESTVPIKRFACMDEVTGIVAFLASDLASYMVGSDVIVDGGYCIS